LKDRPVSDETLNHAAVRDVGRGIGANQNLGIWLRQNYGALGALGLFVVLFGAYIILHPRGFQPLVIQTAANEGIALSLVAMAQTVPVLTGGLDLSVGAILALTNCLASNVVNGTPLQIALGILLVTVAGTVCGLLNGVIIVYGRLQPIIATLATGAAFTGIAYLLRPIPGGDIDSDLGDVVTGMVFDVVPVSLLLLAAAAGLWIAFKRSTLGRAAYAAGSSENAAYMSGLNVGRAKIAAYALSGLFASMGGLFLGFQTLSGDAHISGDYTLRSIAAVVIGGTSLLGGAGGAVGSIFGAYALRTITGVLFFSGVSPLTQSLYEGFVLLAAIGLGAVRLLQVRNRLDLLTAQEVNREQVGARRFVRGIDNAVLVSCAAIVAIVLLGSLYLPDFLSLNYLVQQLRIASFLGIVASGAMVVILLGQIDLSIPWTMTVAAMVATAMTGLGDAWSPLAIPAGLLVGAIVGFVNGIGAGFIRLPSMILTLATNAVLLGLAVVYTGGFAPQTKASSLMRWLGRESSVLGIPNVLWVWLVLGAGVAIVLRRTAIGRAIFATGNREVASYLSGIRTSRVICLAFVFSGLCNALGGILLAGRLDQSYQGMGNEYLLPAIAAVVLGGTHILGGRGTYLGTVVGVLVITLISSVLAVMQIPEASRQIIYGVVIITMLLLHGRGAEAVR
jgi:ribose transport system permease protein